jgi:mannose-6-phosphate isomerase-like protein (cupin superfamily)
MLLTQLTVSMKFEGELYNFPASFFLIADAPDNPGPPLHLHPYLETWIVRSGSAEFTAGDARFEASAGDILVVDSNTPHKYRNAGDSTLELICTHPSPRMIQTNLE